MHILIIVPDALVSLLGLSETNKNHCYISTHCNMFQIRKSSFRYKKTKTLFCMYVYNKQSF